MSSRAPAATMMDDDIQEVEAVPIKQEMDTGGGGGKYGHGQYSGDTQVATGAEYDDSQYFEEYDESYTEDYGQASMAGDKGKQR